MNDILKWFSSVFSTLCNVFSSEPTSTIVAGVVVFVLCEWAKEVWQTPLQEYKKLKARVSFALVMYAQYFANPAQTTQLSEGHETSANEMRIIASDLAAFTECMPLIHVGIPSPKKIKAASDNLIGLSNSFFVSAQETPTIHARDIEKYKSAIKKALRLRG